MHHVQGGRRADRPTVICISPLDTRACARSHTHTHKAPSFKVEVEGLLELVACDCVLMKERLRRGDKAAGRGREVLAGIRIIIRKKPCLQKKKTHTMDEGLSCRPPLVPSSLHQLSQLTFQRCRRRVARQPSASSVAPVYSPECGFLFFFFFFRRLDRGSEENAGMSREREKDECETRLMQEETFK